MPVVSIMQTDSISTKHWMTGRLRCNSLVNCIFCLIFFFISTRSIQEPSCPRSAQLIYFTAGLKDHFSEQHLLLWITEPLVKKPWLSTFSEYSTMPGTCREYRGPIPLSACPQDGQEDTDGLLAEIISTYPDFCQPCFLAQTIGSSKSYTVIEDL